MLFFLLVLQLSESKVHQSFHYSVSEVKNERNCNASYIFSAVSAFESAYATERNSGSIINFSEQYLVSNLMPDPTSSCNGGNVSDSLDFLTSQGTFFEPVYPYFGQPIGLPDKEGYPKIQLSSFTRHYFSNSSDFMLALIERPLIVKFRYDDYSFLDNKGQNYLCNQTKSAIGIHYMLAVASFPTLNGLVLLKNNWGLGWGQSGYLRLNLTSNDPGGPCGLLEEVYSVTFLSSCEL